LKAPQVRRSEASSKSKFYSIIQLRHRDEVEAPITDWLREAYEYADPSSGGSVDPPKKATRRPPKTSKRSTTRARKTTRSSRTPASRTKRAKRH